MGDDKAISYQTFAIGITVVFAIMLFIVSRTTWEMTPEEAGYDVSAIEAEKKQPFGFARWCKNVGNLAVDYISTFRISSFRKFMGIYLTSHCMMDVFGQTFVFFVIFCWGKNAAFAAMLLSIDVVTKFFTPLWGYLFSKIGPKNVFKLAFGPGIVPLGTIFATWKIQPAMGGGAWTAVAIASCLFWLVARSLIWFPCWTVIGLVLSWIIALTFRLDKRTDGILNGEINRLKNGGSKTEVASEAKKVVESLAGVPIRA